MLCCGILALTVVVVVRLLVGLAAFDSGHHLSVFQQLPFKVKKLRLTALPRLVATLLVYFSYKSFVLEIKFENKIKIV